MRLRIRLLLMCHRAALLPLLHSWRTTATQTLHYIFTQANLLMLLFDHLSCFLSLSLFRFLSLCISSHTHLPHTHTHKSVATKSCCNVIGPGSTSLEPMGPWDRSVDCWTTRWLNHLGMPVHVHVHNTHTHSHTHIHMGQMRGSRTCLAYRTSGSVSKRKRDLEKKRVKEMWHHYNYHWLFDCVCVCVCVRACVCVRVPSPPPALITLY